VRTNRTRARIRVLFALALLPLIVAACTGKANHADGAKPRSAVTALPHHGAGTATVTLSGVGSRPGPPRPWPGVVYVKGSSRSFTQSVGVSGQVTLGLPPGTYTVTGRSPRYQDGLADCRAEHVANVVPGRTTTVAVYCRMR